MIKKMTFAVVALLGFASQGFARHPFDNDPIANTPSVLVKAQAPQLKPLPPVAPKSRLRSEPTPLLLSHKLTPTANGEAPVPRRSSR